MKLLKNIDAKLSDIMAKLTDAGESLEDLIDGYNAKIHELFAPIATAADEYNELLESANRIIDEIASDAEAEYDERSDKWHESDRGQSLQEFIGEWRGAVLDEIDIEEPRGIDSPDLNAVEVLDCLPRETEQ